MRETKERPDFPQNQDELRIPLGHAFIICLIILFISLFVLLAPPADAQTPTCDAATQAAFGPFCLNPTTQSPSGYLPLDAVIFFPEEAGTDIGIVQAYSWQPHLGEYWYYVMVEPPDLFRLPVAYGGRYLVIDPAEAYQ